MKLFRKFAALALCALLLLSARPALLAAEDAQLRFDENGEFKILIVADTQDIDRPQKATIALLEAELDAAQPDLVVFLGDQIHGPSTGSSIEKTAKALDAILQPENFTGRSEQQTEEFVDNCIRPILAANASLIGEHYEMKN